MKAQKHVAANSAENQSKGNDAQNIVRFIPEILRRR